MKMDEIVGLISELRENLRVLYKRYSTRIEELARYGKKAFVDFAKIICDSFDKGFIEGLCVTILLCAFGFPFLLIISFILTVAYSMMMFLLLRVAVKTVIRRMKSKIILTATKQIAYTQLRYNLWRMLKTYQEDFKIRLPENACSMTPSNPYVLRGNVWMCCYNLRKRQPIAFDSENLEFITDTLNDEIEAMISNRAFEGVVYPCNYRFVIDEVIDSRNTVRVYVLLIEDARDIAYVNSRNAVNHEVADVPETMGDDDFGS